MIQLLGMEGDPAEEERRIQMEGMRALSLRQQAILRDSGIDVSIVFTLAYGQIHFMSEYHT